VKRTQQRLLACICTHTQESERAHKRATAESTNSTHSCCDRMKNTVHSTRHARVSERASVCVFVCQQTTHGVAAECCWLRTRRKLFNAIRTWCFQRPTSPHFSLFLVGQSVMYVCAVQTSNSHPTNHTTPNGNIWLTDVDEIFMAREIEVTMSTK
jgi:hypothetical protein